MKKITLIRTPIHFFCFALLFACTVKKRHYSNGYTIFWNKNRTEKLVTNKELNVKEHQNKTNLEFLDATIDQKITNLTPNLELPLEANAKKNSKKIASKAVPSKKNIALPQLKQYKFKPIKALPSRDNKPDDTLAICILVFSIICFFFVPLIGSIITLILAKSLLKKIRTQPDKYSGENLAEIARIISLVGLVLWLVILAIIITYLAVLFTLFGV